MAVPFFLFLLGTMEVSYDMYVQEALDYAAFQASRQVSVGQVRGPFAGSGDFVNRAVCPSIGGMLVCGLVTAQLNCIGGNTFYGAQQEAPPQSGTVVNSGLPAQFMYLQLWYAGPSFVGQLIPGFADGNFVHFTFSSAGFVNEQFVGGQQC